MTRECKCDPPGSGEEFCTGHCELRARIAELEAQPHLEQVLRDIAAWGDRTFPGSTWRAAALHLIEESVEVLMADPDRPTMEVAEADRLANDLLRVVEGTVLRSLARPSQRPAEEIADVYLLGAQLFVRHACADPLSEVQRKFAIVQKRVYGPPEPDGVVHRVGWSEGA